MAKSTRSKTKRSFRRAKREEIEKSAYAVAHAARLERLNRKLAAIAQAPGLPTSLSDTTPKPSSGEEDARHEDSDDQGWPFFALLGLVDPDEIAALGPLSVPLRRRRRSSSSSYSFSESLLWSPSGESDDADADSMSGLSAVAWQYLSESAIPRTFS